MRRGRWARLALRALRWIVPRDRRREWREEWEGELDALLRVDGDDRRYPGLASFVGGALPHAVWMRKEEWTMDSVAQDLGYAWRVLRRSPGFTLVAALTLALGIGANGAIFSLVNGLVLQPPAGIVEPDRLVQVARSYDEDPRWDNWSSPAIRLFEAESRTLSGVAGYQAQGFTLGRGTDVAQVTGQWVTGRYFELLGVRAHVGRLIRPEDHVAPGGHAVVVLSHGLWTRRYGADPGIVGRTISVGAEPYEVLGVAPAGFAGPDALGSAPQLWIPSMQHPGFYGDLPFEEWGFSWLNVVGRLAEGVSFAEAEASMEVLTSRLRAASGSEDIRILLAPGIGLDPEERNQARQVSGLLMGIVGLVLLITCLNVANLFLARAASRTSEVGVRKALGAGRRRLARQLVTESLLLAVLATLVAIPLVLSVGRFLPMLFPYTLSISTGPDARVFAFLVAIGLGAGLLFGAAPAWAAVRGDVVQALREGRQEGTRDKTRLRDLLVVGQLALSLGLVAGAALLGRSVVNARGAEPGFEPDGLVVGIVDLGSTGRYDEETGRVFYRQVLDELRALPGVAHATLANQAPIHGGHSRASVAPEGLPDDWVEAEYIQVGGDYFETLGIEIVEGRALTGAEVEGDPVAVVNETLAEMFWPGESAIGKRLDRGESIRVVGVARDVQMRSLRAAANPAVYYPVSQSFASWVVLHARSTTPAGAFVPRLREAVANVDPELPVIGIADMTEAMAASMGETRTIGRLIAVFAGLALVLAAVGLYGVVSFGVSRRVREMGIRKALGAGSTALVHLVLRRGIGLTVLGVVAGLGVSYLVGQAFQGLLFGIPPTDPLTLAGAAAVLTVTALVAAWIPARRASRVSPMTSLRDG